MLCFINDLGCSCHRCIMVFPFEDPHIHIETKVIIILHCERVIRLQNDVFFTLIVLICIYLFS